MEILSNRGGQQGFKDRIERENNKRVAAEIAVAVAYDNLLKKKVSSKIITMVEHVLANSMMFEGSPESNKLKEKLEGKVEN